MASKKKSKATPATKSEPKFEKEVKSYTGDAPYIILTQSQDPRDQIQLLSEEVANLASATFGQGAQLIAQAQRLKTLAEVISDADVRVLRDELVSQGTMVVVDNLFSGGSA